jgi:hypothetical protein
MATLGGGGSLTSIRNMRLEARAYFWQAFFRLKAHPKMTGLMVVLEMISELYKHRRSTSEAIDDDSFMSQREIFQRKHPEMGNLIDSWLKKCGLEGNEWAFEEICEHLETWNSEVDFGISHGRVLWEWGGYIKPPSYSNPPTLPRFNPEMTTLQDYLDEAEELVREYSQRIIDDFKATGKLCEPIDKKSLENFDWLVRYQVLGQRPGEIADEVGLRRALVGEKKRAGRKDNTVRDGIKLAAELVDLKGLRPFKKGR